MLLLLTGILEKYGIKELISIYDSIDEKEVLNISKKVEKVICIGNSNTYFRYMKCKLNNLEYIPFKNLAIYYKNEKHKEIAIELYEYACLVGIEAEIYEDIDIEEFIKCITVDNCLENVVAFVDNKENEDIIKTNINTRNLFINKNPFEKEIFKIEKPI